MRLPSPLVPPRLHPGEPIALIAPSGPVPEARLRGGLALLSARYEVRWNRRLLDRSGFLAGDDDSRLEALTLALADDKIRAVVCARGGYGLMRILARIDPSLFTRRPKPIVGFSDVTALHALAQRAGLISIHGPVATQLADLPGSDAEALFGLLEGAPGAPMEGLTSVGKQSVVEGPLVGGNLELVTRLLGTPYALPMEGAVLLLEEVGERPYRIDRQLTQLELSGSLAQVAAVVVGDLVRCTEPDGTGPSADEVVRERLGRLGIPVLVGLPVGHGERNRAMALGARVRVDGKAGKLEPLEPATR